MTVIQIDPFSSATDMLRALEARRLSASELLELHLCRIERYNPKLNAIVTPNYHEARRLAASVDEASSQRDGNSPAPKQAQRAPPGSPKQAQRAPPGSPKPAAGYPGMPLRGLPITIKDCIYVKGLTLSLIHI